MKRVGLIAICVLLLCSLCGCGEQTLGLYVLPADSISDVMTAGEIADVVQEKGRLALDGSDFAGVDWENQCYAVKAEASASVSVITAQSGGSSILKTTDSDVFVWMLSGKVLYVGGFEKGSASVSAQKDPYIKDKERYIFSIETVSSEGDKRFNDKLYNYFYKQGLIKSEL